MIRCKPKFRIVKFGLESSILQMMFINIVRYKIIIDLIWFLDGPVNRR